MGDMKNEYSILVGKPTGKRLLGKPKRKWKDIIIMDLREIVGGGICYMGACGSG
jgi:hypothetical protein